MMPRRSLYRSVQPTPREHRSVPKETAVRSKVLTDLAHRIHECTLNLPGVCIGYSVDGCEPAHSNFSDSGKGGARKADDHLHAAACHPCHAELDQGRRFTLDEKVSYWRVGHYRTFGIYFREKWLKVA